MNDDLFNAYGTLHLQDNSCKISEIAIDGTTDIGNIDFPISRNGDVGNEEPRISFLVRNNWDTLIVVYVYFVPADSVAE